jgi:[ribosomal protein S18]-alanine N-acetyltransferase
MDMTSQIELGRDAPTRKEAAMHSVHKQEIRVHIRWMIRRDMAEVLQIERESFEYPWVDEDFIRCLRQRNCIGMVAEHEGRVVGFMIYELHRTRIHVLNFAVSRICHRLGVGSQMIAKLIAKLSAQRRSRIVLEVRETNVDAQLFFRENGFRAISILHAFYDDTPEDAYLMQYRYRAEKPVEVDSTERTTRRAA